MPEDARKRDDSPTAELQVPMPDIVRFVRQLSHDLRNHLNAAELQAAYLKEIIDDAETKEEVQRLRAMMSELGTSLQQLTVQLAPVKLTLMPYEAATFVEDLRHKVEATFGDKAAEFEWQTISANAVVEIDPQLLQQAMLALFTNALDHQRGEGKIVVAANADDGRFTVTLREPKAAFEPGTTAWGAEPFKTVKHGHYALGLYRVRRIVEAHHGEFTASYDPNAATLTTTVSLPLGHAA